MSCDDCSTCGDGGCESLLPTTELPTSLPLVAYDGDCSFCRRWMKRYHAISPPERLGWCPHQKAAGHYPGVSEEQFAAAVHVMQPDGTYTRGAEAIFEIMHRVDLRSWPWRLYRWFPPVRWITEAGYRWVAAHRGAADRINTLAWGKIEIPSTTLLTRRIFIRLLGLVFLIAFLSVQYQSDALFGPNGLFPVERTLASWRADSGGETFLTRPSVLWLGPQALTPTIVTGLVAAGAVMLGMIPMLTLAVCWMCYLSLVTAGAVFLDHPGDALLLEIGFLAIFWAPCSWWLNGPRVRRPSTLIRWVLIWLLIRITILSGWSTLTSMTTGIEVPIHHLWTHPLPIWTAWSVWQLPAWLQNFLILAAITVELGMPILLLLPRVPRLVAFVALASIQVGLILTGNDGFLHFLMLVLCVVVLDDSQLLWLWIARVRGTIRVGLPPAMSAGRRVLNLGVAAFVLSISLSVTVSQLGGLRSDESDPPTGWADDLKPWRIAGTYEVRPGTILHRPEITIEGSRDGTHWQPYVFRYKPGPVDRPPGWCQPYLPRLDWQMWSVAQAYDRTSVPTDHPEAGAAGGIAAHQVVFYRLLQALASGNQTMVELLESSPFSADDPPTWLRWHLDHYRPAGSDASADAWWIRTRRFSSGPIAAEGLR